MYKKITTYIKQNKFAFWFALLYVCLGGMQAYTFFPDDVFFYPSTSLNILTWLFTLPVNMFCGAYRFCAKTPSVAIVIVIQALLFPLVFIAMVKLLKRLKK